MDAELAERGVLDLAIGRMIFDGLDVAAELVALVQHWRMAIGEPRAFIEMAAGQSAEPVEMRLDVAEQGLGQMQLEQIGQRGIGAVEIHSRRVGRQQARLAGGRRGQILRMLLH